MSRSINPQTQQLAQDLIDPLFPLIAQRLAANRGTSFPSGAAAGDLFFRTDLYFLCVYDGTRWLTVTLYETPVIPRSPLPLGANEALELFGPTYNRKLHSAVIDMFVNTTNNGSNYWRATPRSGITGAGLGSEVNTSAQSTGQWVTQTIDLSGVAVSTEKIDILVQKAGSPGTLYVSGCFRYRNVIP